MLPIHNLEFVRREIAPYFEIPFKGNSESIDRNPTLFRRLA